MKTRDCFWAGKPVQNAPCRFPARFSASIHRCSTDIRAKSPNSGLKFRNARSTIATPAS